MQVLLIDAYQTDSPDRTAAADAADALRARGHAVEHVVLDDAGFADFMSADERAAYHSDDPLICDATRASATAVQKADALLFCYPTTTFTIPATLKGWLERVLVPGVAFIFNDAGRIVPGMTNVRRLGVITTTPHSGSETRRARDLGRRTILWTIRLSCHRFCRRTFLRMPSGTASADAISRALRRW